MSFERGGQSGDCLGGSPLHTLLPSGRWQDNQTPTTFAFILLWILNCIHNKSPFFGMPLASVVLV